MKNTLKVKAIWRLIGIIALVAIIGFAAVSCSGSGSKDGIITITDIPAKYNGKFIKLEAADYPNNIFIIGIKGFDYQNDNHYLVQITNGKAELPAWTITEADVITSYSGNHTIGAEIMIYSGERLYSNELAYFAYESITFKKGGVNISFKKADEFEENDE